MSDFPRGSYRTLERYTPERRPVEVDLCDNTNLWGAHPAALEAARAAPAEALTRYPAAYADPLREGIAARFGVPTASVTTGCGSDDLLDSAFRAVCEPGTRVASLSPTFSMIGPLTKMNGLESCTLPGWPAPPDPERILEADPALVYLCRPNNPTGEALERRWVENLLQAVGPDGPVVLLDEAYVDFADGQEGAEGAGDLSLLREAASSARLLVLRTFSKAYGLAGLRVGFAVGAPDVVAEVEKSRGPYKVGYLAERAALAALEDGAGWVPSIVREVRTNRRRLAVELEERGFRPLPSAANFLLVPLASTHLEPLGAAGASRGLRRQGVAVRPFPALPGIGDALRVTIGPWSMLERFLDALGRLQEGDA